MNRVYIFHTFFIAFFAILLILSFFFLTIFHSSSHTKGGGGQPFLKNSAYYVVDLIHSLAFQFTNYVDKPKAKYFSVICLPYLFHSLVYQTLYNL